MGRILLIPLDNSDISFSALEWSLKSIVQPDDFMALLHCYDTTSNDDASLSTTTSSNIEGNPIEFIDFFFIISFFLK